MFNYDIGGARFHYDQSERNIDGGAGSGNWGHAGRPGKRGGSSEGGGSQYRLSTPDGGYTSRSQAEKENKQRDKTAKASGNSGGSKKGMDANGNIIDHVGTNNGKQKVLGRVTPNKNLKKITNAAGGHQVAEGQDISKTFKRDDASKWSEFEQVAYQQGYKNPPQIVTDREAFEKIVEQSRIIMFRTENDAGSKSASEIIDDFKNYDSEVQKSNWSGMKAHGEGIYYASNITVDPANQNTPKDGEEKAQSSSAGYSDGTGHQYRATLQPGAKIISEQAAINMYMADANGDAGRYNSVSAYIAAKGYDGIQYAFRSGKAYTMVYNTSKIVVFDENEF